MSKIAIGLFLFSVFCIFSSMSLAAPHSIDCKNATDEWVMGPCSFQDFEAATATLSHAEAVVQKSLHNNRQALKVFSLDRSDWQQYMLNRCSDPVLGFNEDGNGITSSIARGYCKADLMNKRAKELKNYIH